MLKVDLIVPFFTIAKRSLRSPTGIKKYQYFFPVWLYQNDLKDMGVKVRFLNLFNLKYNKLSNIVGLSPLLPYIVANYKHIIKKLRKYVDYIIWFEQSDGTPKAHFPALPYVDKYYRSALFKDLSLYNNSYHKENVFVDYYVKNYKLDVYNKRPEGKPIDPKHKHKIGLSWNFGICDLRYTTKLEEFLYGLTRKYKLKFFKPSKNRKLLFSANYSIMKGYDIVYFQRKQLSKFLRKKYGSYKNVSIGQFPKKQYINNLRSSKANFSPFGWGELCYRDSEVFFSGGALIKPDMEHLKTWPNLYKKDETYISIPWKIEEWDEIIPEILSDEDKLFEIAKNGQNSFKRLWTKEGKIEFCQRFVDMVTPD